MVIPQEHPSAMNIGRSQLSINVYDGDLSAGPHICRARALPTEPPPMGVWEYFMMGDIGSHLCHHLNVMIF